MCPAQPNPARRALLVRGAGLAGLAAGIAALGASRPSAAKAAKSDFMYQDHGRDGKNCGACKFFAPDGPDPNIGKCSIVAGTISRDGWCMAFAPIASNRE